MDILLDILLRTLISVVIAIAVHEAGHYLVARLFGYKPRLEFNRLQIWKMWLVQFVVTVDEPMTDTARRAFGIAGFGVEFGLCAVILTIAWFAPAEYCLDLLLQLMYQLIFTWLHFIAYTFYNKGSQANDFNKLI